MGQGDRCAIGSRHGRRLAKGLVMGLAMVSGPACLGESPAVGGVPSPPPDDRPLVLPELVSCDPSAPVPEQVRVATWNMSAGRRSSLDDVQQVLAQIDADVVLLQEVDVGVRRTGQVDQPRVLGEGLDMQYGFAAALEFDGGDFGMAMLSRLPVARAERISLDSEGGYEPRIAFDFTVCAGGQPLRMIDVHADFVPDVNVRNLLDLAGRLGSIDDASTIVGGDFNATPQTEGVTGLIDRTEAVDVLASRDPGATRDGERIDYLLTDAQLDAAIVEAVRVETDASDHTPLWADIALR